MLATMDNPPAGPARGLPAAQTLNACIDSVTSNHPDSPALLESGRTHTFADLGARKRQYVQLLDEHAVGPGDCVALHGWATTDHIAAMLAIMHRGAVAVPLAATFPRAYRNALLERAGASLVLTDTPDTPQALSWLPESAQAAPADDAATAGADTPFLLMFTSGSTGQPKGVLHAHRQPVNRFRWMSEAFPLEADEVCAARPTVSIMPSIWELFGGLCAGRPTLLVDADALNDPARWVRMLAQASVTRMTLMPSLLRVLLTELQQLPADDRPPLRLLTVGGEPLPDRLVQRHHELLPGCRLLEDYGATEVNTIGFGLRDTDGTALYQPINGMRIGVAGEDGAPVRGADEGELCVAGEGLALSYWGDTAQTEARFGRYGGLERAYRTGDRARLLPDGRFLLLGRTRDQVKINGLTVDLVAIECALRDLPGVYAAAAFTTQPDGSEWTQLCAAVTGVDGLAPENLRTALRDALPLHMVPLCVVLVPSLPRLDSGKPDRAALPGLVHDGAAASAAPGRDVASAAHAAFVAVTGQSLDADSMDATWDACGLDSVSTVAFAQAVTRATGRRCSATDLFDHPTPRRFLDFLANQDPGRAVGAVVDAGRDSSTAETAISGMSAMVPGAPSLDALWPMIRDGSVEAPRVPLERWPGENADDSALRGTFLDDVMGLDASLHGLSPTESRHADPQLRLVLRSVRHCLQDAGLSRSALAGQRVGVFLGCRPSGFAALEVHPAAAQSPEAFLGGDEAMMAARVSHLLDLHGPAITLNTTCSSGLVALHLARQAIAAGECEMAIVCAVSVMCDPEFLRKTARLGVTSASGACRPFDASADGFVPSEGVGCLLLEGVEAARRAGRAPWARVVASGLNHDGLSKSLTSPNGAAQSTLLDDLYAASCGSLERVAYLETHGTGTALGDPIECGALSRVWDTASAEPVALGSVKGNIGHANAAAGLLGLIKTALCLHNRTIPPLAGFERPNPQLSEQVLRRFDFPATARPWPDDRPLAGVSAFGMSGTNAHVLLSAEKAQQPAPPPAGTLLSMPLSAPTQDALRPYAAALADQLGEQPAPSLPSIAATLHARTREEHCVWLSTAGVDELRTQLRDVAEGRSSGRAEHDGSPPPEHTTLAHLAVSNEVAGPRADQRMTSAPPRAADGSRPVDLPRDTAPDDGSTTRLTELLARSLGEQDWTRHADTRFRDLGLDSIRAISLRDALRDDWGLRVSEFDLLEQASLATLRVLRSDAGPAEAPAREAARPTGQALPDDIPASGRLTDLQTVYLTAKLTGQDVEGRLGAWNVLVLDAGERLDHDRLTQAWAAVCARHGMLRVGVAANGRQRIAESAASDVPLSRDDEATCDGVIASMMNDASGLSEVPMARLHLLRGVTADRLVVGVDSFAADAHSTSIFLDELWQTYEGQPPAGDLHPNAFLGVLARRRETTTPASERAARSHWAARLDGHTPATVESLQPVGVTRGDTESGWARLSYAMTTQDTEALTQQARAAGTPILTCLFERFRQWVATRAARPVFIGLTVAERPPDLEGADEIVGPFTEMMLHPISAGTTAEQRGALAPTLESDLGHRALSGTAVLRELALDPPRIVFSSVTQRPMRKQLDTVRALSITSGVQLHAHATRDPRGVIHLEWDVDLAHLPSSPANTLFDEFCRQLAATPSAIPDAAPAVTPGQHRTSSLDRAPLTRAMRSYQATQAMTRGRTAPSYAMRTYRIDPEELPAIHRRWQQLLTEHAALHSVQTPRGQVRASARSAAATITEHAPQPGQDLDTWIAEVEQSEAQARADSQWSPMRLAAGRHENSQYVFFTFDCHALDAPATLIAPQLVLSAERFGADTDAGFDYARWQEENAGDEHDQAYWRSRLDDLRQPALSPPTHPEHTWTRMWQCRFPRPDASGTDEVAAKILAAFQRSLIAFPELAKLPVIVVSYPDRTERDGWRHGLGDFSSFGFLAPRCADAGSDAVRASLDADRQHRRADWFPLIADRVGAGRVLFPTAFTDALSSDLDCAEPAGAAVRTTSRTAGLAIDCLAYSTGQDICVEWSVNTSVANTETAERAFVSFRSDVSDALRPDVQSSAAAFQEQQNRTACPYDEQATMVQLFDRSVARYPDQVALVDDEGSWSYAELAAAVGRYADALSAEYGIGDGDIVAVRLRRERRLPALLLAILRLGAAFVPLNSEDPTERHNRMLQRSRARLVVVSEPDTGLTADAVTVDALDRTDRTALPTVADASVPDGMAYVIFTSGSTGEPKGVMVRHRPFVNLAEDLQKRYGFGPQDRGIWVNSIGFDLSVFDVFGLLAQGASLRIVNESDRLDPPRIARIIGEEPVTFWNSAPVYFHAVISQLLSRRFQGTCDLRLAFLSGDWMPLNLARQCLEHLPSMRTVALGGATEAVIWSNLHEIREVRAEWRSIPYGRPIQNAQYRILDAAMSPVAMGEPGDLFIGGECLADGYINAPDLNARAFIPDPFTPGGTLYRTGDEARFMPSGEIEFLGRSDKQVKIRGHRIELGEIEHAMETVGYSTPVVLATEGGQGNVVLRSLIGFCVGAEPEGASATLATLLPSHMQMSRLIAVSAYPTTANGKLDDKALLRLAEERSTPAVVQPTSSAVPLRESILDTVAELLECETDSLDLSLGLGHQGFNSLHFALLANGLSDLLGQGVATADILTLPSLDSVLDYAAQRAPEPAPAVPTLPLTHGPDAPPAVTDGDADADAAIAVIGLYCRMPDADDVESFWRNIAEGRDGITEIPESRWDWQAVYGNDPNRDESLSRWGGFLSDVDRFDPSRFNISPREAAAMDPRQRLTLTGTWQLLEDAGYAPITRTPSDTGLFLGVTGDEYGALLAERGAAQDQLTLIGTGRSFIANRINYAMNWSGPSEVIDTTCSSSLVAIHHAVSALRGGDCAMAVAGGVSVLIDPRPHVSLSKVGVLSPEGRCKTFDSRADGYVRSEGVGLVLLKPLSRAMADGDRVRAVIRACRINHGGRSSALTAPNAAAQAALLDATFKEAGLGIAGLGLHESHGTGTRLGDPIEVTAYQTALRAQLSREDLHQPPTPVSMGSVKSAIGHTEAAAGVAGFIKAVKALEARAIPPLVHFRERNPEIGQDAELLRFDTAMRDWPEPSVNGVAVPRRASVSAFGFGGVNAFAVLEEAPARARDVATDREDLFVLSARSPEDLTQQATSLADWIEGPGAGVALADVAFTLRSGRVQDRQRFAVVADERTALVAALRTAQPVSAQNAADADALADAVRNGALATAAEQWTHGADADWSRHEPAGWPRPQRAELPLSPLHEAPYWHPRLERDPAATRAVWRNPGNRDGAPRFRVTARDGFLADHVIGGQAMLPGAAWIAAAAQALGGPGTLFLRDLTFRAPLVVDGAPNADVLGMRAEDQLTFVRADDPDAPLCSLRLGPDAGPGESAPLGSYRRSYRTEHDADACAGVFADLGVDYGPLYRVAQACWHAPDEALLHVRLPDEASADGGLAIPLLDGLFQGVVLFEALNGRRRPRVPIRAEAVSVFRDPGRAGYVRVRLADDGRRHDAWLYDESGRLCVRITGVSGHTLPETPAAPARTQSKFVGYAPTWVPATLEPGGGCETRTLRWHGQQSLQHVEDWLTSELPGLTVAVDASGDQGDVLAGCAALLQAVCAFPSSATIGPRSIVLLVPEAAEWAGPVSSGLAGLVETIGLEHPSLRVAVLVSSDDDGSAPSGRLHAARAHGLYRTRGTSLQTLTLRPIEPADAARAIAPEADAAPGHGFVLISGGAGSVGAEIGRMLAARGVPVLALGRARTPSQALPERVHYQAVDVTDRAALSAVLESWRANLGPVRAVYHCAGLTPGGLFARRDPGSIARQLDVKLRAAANLDHVTARDAPDVFVACSSLVAHSGVVGCADYAMANRAMEGFITAREARRPGRSVSFAWSAWPAGGMQFTGTQAKKVADEGIRPVSPIAAQDWITRVLGTPGLTVAVSPFGDADAIRSHFGKQLASTAAI